MQNYPVVLLVSMEAKTGAAVQMQDLLKEIAAMSQIEEGCEIYQILQDPVHQDRFLLLERWKDKQSFQAHQKAPHLVTGLLDLEQVQSRPAQFESLRAIN